jgi:hypothetical protein
MTIPEGWTDDLTISLPPGRTVDELATRIMRSLIVHTPFEEIYLDTRKAFSLSSDDAHLAIDRVQGGIIRALTGRLDNKSDKIKDPIAFSSFEAVWKTFPRKRWLPWKRVPGGLWERWYEERKPPTS